MGTQSFVKSRWSLRGLVAATALVSGLFWWWFFTPEKLTPVEQQLVGAWEMLPTPIAPKRAVHTFFPNRILTIEQYANGPAAPPVSFKWTWRVEGDTLIVRYVDEMTFGQLIKRLAGEASQEDRLDIISLTSQTLSLAKPDQRFELIRVNENSAPESVTPRSEP